MSTLLDIRDTTQLNLFSWFAEILDPLTEKEQQFISVVSLLDLGKHTRTCAWRGFGRRRKSRLSLAKAFIAKSVYNFETTEILIGYLKACKNLRRLCGWENRWPAPSKATFSRAFSEFAQRQLPEKIHEAMVKTHRGSTLAGHINRDSTAIEGREKPAKKSRNDLPKRKRGRPKKLSGSQIPWIYRTLRDKDPQQLKFPFYRHIRRSSIQLSRFGTMQSVTV